MTKRAYYSNYMAELILGILGGFCGILVVRSLSDEFHYDLRYGKGAYKGLNKEEKEHVKQILK